LERTPGDRPVLQLNDASWEVMRGQRAVRLMRPKAEPVRETRSSAESWEGVDRELFEHLREVRKELAKERGVPAFVIFSDATLRDMARRKPTTIAAMAKVFGVGKAKLADLGDRFVDAVRAFEAK